MALGIISFLVALAGFVVQIYVWRSGKTDLILREIHHQLVKLNEKFPPIGNE